mgnify:CR=1 FL=1
MLDIKRESDFAYCVIRTTKNKVFELPNQLTGFDLDALSTDTKVEILTYIEYSQIREACYHN